MELTGFGLICYFVVFFLVVLGIPMVLKSFLVKRRTQKGDLFFAKGDFQAAKKKYKAVIKIASGKKQAEFCLRLALTQLVEKKDLDKIKNYFRDALNSFPKITYSDLEKLARQYEIKLSEKIYSIFRKAELAYLEKLLTLPRQASQGDLTIFITHVNGVFGAFTTTGGLKPSVTVTSAIHEDPTTKRLTIEVYLRTDQCGISSAQMRYAAGSAIKKELTYSDIAIALTNDREVKSEIAQEIASDIGCSIRAIFNFFKDRRSFQEIDDITIAIKKNLPIQWVSEASEILWVSEMNIKSLPATILYDVHVDLAKISELADISDEKLAELWGIKGNQIYIQFGNMAV